MSTAVPTGLAALVWTAGAPADWLTGTLIAGLLVFAVNPSLHSCPILAFAQDARVTVDVVFHNMANATGRPIGTLLSGLTCQAVGLPLCLGAAAAMVAPSWLGAGRLKAQTGPP